MAIWLKILLGGGIGLAGGALLGYFGKCASGACPLTANPYRGGLIGAIIGVLFALALTTGGCRSGKATADKVRELTSEEEFAEVVINADKPVLVDFYTQGCGYCVKLAPTIEKLSAEYEGRADVVKLDGQKLTSLRDKYGIEGYPTVLLFVGGEKIDGWPGLRDAAEYREALNRAVQ